MSKLTKTINPNASFLENLGSRIKSERRKLNLSQQELGERLGYFKKDTISLWENGKRAVPLEVLVKLAKEFNVSTDYLLGNTESKQVENTEISRKLGLNDTSINILEKFVADDVFQKDILYGDLYNYQDYSLIVNNMISDKNFIKLIFYIRAYINSKKLDKLKKEISLNTVIGIDEFTEEEITYKDYLDGFFSNEYSEDNPENFEIKDFDCNSEILYNYQIKKIFEDILNSITKNLEPSFAERWILSSDKKNILKICNDGSEKIKMLKSYNGISKNDIPKK